MAKIGRESEPITVEPDAPKTSPEHEPAVPATAPKVPDHDAQPASRR